MISKPLEFVLQGFLVDEDDEGGVVGKVALEPVVFPGVSIRTQLAKHLASVERLCAERTAELQAAKPNRAQRREAKRRS